MAPHSLCVLLVAAQSCALASAANITFVHPGALDTKASLDFVKAQIAAGAQPWKAAFDGIRDSDAATRGPHALTHIDSNGNDATVSREDSLAAYTQALLWYFTANETYAKGAVAILNAWSGLQGFTGGNDQDKLQAGWVGAVFAPAADIMRGYAGWTPAQIADLQAMFQRAFYPQLNTMSTWNGNVDLTQTDAIMSISVFNEDEAEFNMGLARLKARSPAYFYLTADGAEPAPIAGDGGDVKAFWSNPVKWVDGLNQETCRDNGHHSQFALGSAMHAAEVAWNQGVDVYTPHTARYTAALELLASQLLSGTVTTCRSTSATRDRYDTWEIGYNHYHNRAGVDLPHTHNLIVQQIRPKICEACGSCSGGTSPACWNLVYETLTHASLP